MGGILARWVKGGIEASLAEVGVKGELVWRGRAVCAERHSWVCVGLATVF